MIYIEQRHNPVVEGQILPQESLPLNEPTFKTRYDGNLVDVYLAGTNLATGLHPAQVCDYSSQDIRLFRFDPLPVAEIVHLGVPNSRHEEAWDTLHWQPLRVTSCREDVLGWVIGCDFVEPPSDEFLHVLDWLAVGF